GRTGRLRISGDGRIWPAPHLAGRPLFRTGRKSHRGSGIHRDQWGSRSLARFGSEGERPGVLRSYPRSIRYPEPGRRRRTKIVGRYRPPPAPTPGAIEPDEGVVPILGPGEPAPGLDPAEELFVVLPPAPAPPGATDNGD